MSTPVLVIGEALVDIVGTAAKNRNGNGKPKAIPGGFAANVAVGLARMGVPTELVARFGTDPYGDLLGAHLFGNGVQLAPGTVDPAVRTSTATATLDADGVATYKFDMTWDPPALSLTRGCPAIHTGSIAMMLEPGASAIREFLKSVADQPVTVTLDPNARPAITPDPVPAWAAVRELAALSDLVKLSDEDCEFFRPGVSLDDIAEELLTAERTQCVVITRGGSGALGVGRGVRVEVSAPTIEVVDTVGAGDSLMAALITGLLRRGLLGERRLAGLTVEDLRDVVDYAVKAAAITCTRHGADPPTAAEHTEKWGS
ncbi:carbohydrate kinase family protein [Kribbella sindirgiensis]|uniref:Carbohydrate kinase n=1 Tax=Kribbella sindirgiensis TaxID=1124744 RepID=A0A4R0J3C4_9ACTN|nr:carbohydrate kinase [Kribbella sindirgiensis]TCC39604.1 carbohydrate kinase [Kribbella sindirgiensis]